MGDIDKQRGLAISVAKHINHIPILAKSKCAPWITNNYRRPAWTHYITVLLATIGPYVCHPNTTDGGKRVGGRLETVKFAWNLDFQWWLWNVLM